MWVPGGIKISVFCTESCTGLATAEVSTVQKQPIIQPWTIGVGYMKLHLNSPAVFLDVPVSGGVEHQLVSVFGWIRAVTYFFWCSYMNYTWAMHFLGCLLCSFFFFFLLHSTHQIVLLHFSSPTEFLTSCVKVCSWHCLKIVNHCK